MATIQAEEKEMLRHVVLERLAVAHPAALTAPQLTRHARMEVDFSVDQTDVAAALEVLRDLGHVRIQVDALGVTKYYQATAQGVLAVERGV